MKILQHMLNGYGMAAPNLTSGFAFDGEVMAAVKKYQRQNHLTVDGVVGAKTWTSLVHGNPRSIEAPPPGAPAAATS